MRDWKQNIRKKAKRTESDEQKAKVSVKKENGPKGKDKFKAKSVGQKYKLLDKKHKQSFRSKYIEKIVKYSIF